MQRVERSVFGELNGKPIHLFRLSNANGMVAELLEFGGRIKALCIPDGQGGLDNMSVGYDTFEPYHAHFNPWLGALLGRTASRVTGARFQIDGKTYNLSASGPAGSNMHGGFVGFDSRVWTGEADSDATGATLQVSVELSELHSALLNLSVVRAKLYDYQATSEARVKLFHEVFSGKTLNKVTMRLAEHATCNLRRRRYLETIQWLINKLSRHMGESMVTVTTATPLKPEQIKRLVEVYSAKVGRQVHINSVVDPTVLGGMRIQVGDEVTDNTVVAQLQNLHRKVQTEATPA